MNQNSRNTDAPGESATDHGRTGTVIVGGGHGGAQAAIAMRQLGYDKPITIISRENELAYERPPLSKEYFLGDKSFDRILIRPQDFWDERAITIEKGVSALTLDPAEKSVKLSDKRSIGYDHLIWATGGDPRLINLPGSNLAGIHSIRTRADVDRLREGLRDGEKVVVVGGGYIGLEAASALRKLGHPVELLEAAPRVLARVAGPKLSEFFEAEHRAHGVELRTGCQIDAFADDGSGNIAGVYLGGDDAGELIEARHVIVGIGIVPMVGALISAGASGGNGVDVDEFCRTSLPGVYAIGDCAAHANSYADGDVIRLESVQNANDQATVAAKDICGSPEPYNALPWFWSNQYDLKLQTAGLSIGYDTEVVRGDPAERSFSVIYLKEGRVIAVDAVNRVKDYVQGRKLVEARAHVTPEQLADTEVPLKELLQG